MTTATLPTLNRSKPILDDDQILAKAIARFNRDRRYAGLPPCQPNILLSEVVENLVALRNITGTLAMYKITRASRLRRIPSVPC
jgi:hypothetical protein